MLPAALRDRPAGHTKLVGGRLCLDFANSVRRWPPEGPDGARDEADERLGAYADLLAWSGRVGALDEDAIVRLWREAERRPDDARAIHARARRLRDAIYAIGWSLAHGRAPRDARPGTLGGRGPGGPRAAAPGGARPRAPLAPAGGRPGARRPAGGGRALRGRVLHERRPLPPARLPGRRLRLALRGHDAQPQPPVVRHGRLREPGEGAALPVEGGRRKRPAPARSPRS